MTQKFYVDYLFCDKVTGEEFIVQEETLDKARAIAAEYFEEPKCICRLEEEEAEWLGLDTY